MLSLPLQRKLEYLKGAKDPCRSSSVAIVTAVTMIIRVAVPVVVGPVHVSVLLTCISLALLQ